MPVAVCIVGFRNSQDIVRCLAALARSTHADFEVVICENGGPEAYADLVAAIPARLASGQAVRAILASGNLGYAGGVNLCMAESPDAEAWWVLNPDTAPDAAALAEQLERLARGDCDAVGCTLRLPDGRVQSYGGRWRGWLARAESIGHGGAFSGPVDGAAIEARQNYLNGASMLISRRFLSVAGPMREDYFLYCEEVEWCLRALSRGLKLGFAPKAFILHHQGSTTGAGETAGSRPRMPIYLGERNKMLVIRDTAPLRLPVAAAAALVLLILRFGRRGAWRQLGYGVTGWAAGLRQERGTPDWVR